MLNLNLNILGLLNSGGGAQASTPPSFLWANGWSESRVDAGLVKVGADSYDFEIATDAGFTNIVDADLATASELTSFTGLTQETTYYVRARSTFGSVKSDWISTSCYTLITPKYAYNFSGIGQNTTNEYGKTGSPGGILAVAEVYSYRGTANTLTPNSTIGTLVTQSITLNNKLSAYTAFNNTKFYKPASNIIFPAGVDYTVIVEMSKNNMGAPLKNLLSNSADALQYLAFNTGGARLGIRTGVFPTPLWPSTPKSYNKQIFIFKRSGTSLYAGIVSDDTTSVAFGAANTNSANNEQVTFNRIFADEVLWYPSKLLFYERALTDAEILKEVRVEQQPTYSFKSNNTSLLPTGVTWGDLSAGNYYINANTAHSATAGGSWRSVYTLGNQSMVRLDYNNDSGLLQDFLKCFRHDNGQVSSNIDMGVIPGQLADGHNLGSLFPMDNTWYHLEMSNHYEGNPTNVLVKRFGDNYNMTEYTLLPSGNNIPSFRGSKFQYLNGARTSDGFVIVGQEWNSAGYAEFITALVFNDNANSCTKIKIINTGNSDYWFYPRVIYSEDDKIHIMVQYYHSALTNIYKNTFYLITTDRFNTVQNIDNSWSKNIVDNNLPVTVAEATTNAIMGIDGTSKSFSVITTSAFLDPTDGKIYGVQTNGDNNGLNFIIDDGAGGWTVTAINVLGEAVVFGYGTGDSVTHGTNQPTMVRTGANSYELYANVVVSGSYPTQIKKVVKFTTSDSWATTDSVVNMTDDDTNNHDRINITQNLHYTGGASAYNEKRLLVCSREFTTPTVKSDTKFMDISI